MQYIDKILGETSIKSDDFFVMCLGNFDGVHIGHRQILSKAKSIALNLKNQNKNVKIGAFTFFDLPTKNSKAIYSFEEKKRLLFEAGVDAIFAFSFYEIKFLSKKNFVNQILKEKCHTVFAVAGENFKFSKNASADSSDLLQLMKKSAEIVPLEKYQYEPISSSKIKALLEEGDIETANNLLVIPYHYEGIVTHGKELGRQIGFPTANVLYEDGLIGKGIYATQISIGDKTYKAVSNVGLRPTVETSTIKNIETYILDYHEDIYGKIVKISFIKKIRDEIKFSSIKDLQNQIALDTEEVKKIL